MGTFEGARTHPVVILLLQMISVGVTAQLPHASVYLDPPATIQARLDPENLKSGYPGSAASHLICAAATHQMAQMTVGRSSGVPKVVK